MHLQNCLNPKVIRNRYTGDLVQVRCNRCSSCLNARAQDWINRLDQESQFSRYVYMVNLTYDNNSVPCLGFTEDMQSLTFINRQSDLCIPLDSLTSLCNDIELELLRDRLLHPLGLPVCCSDDISKFCKRFNKYCFDHVTFKYNNFRYFCAHELGPTTFRPHVHMLIFFQDRLIANRFQEILSACWCFGDSRASAVYSDGGRKYVAQYVNSVTNLPAFYTYSKIRPRCQFSKSPVIGSLSIMDKEISGIYDRLPLYRTVWSSKSGKYCTVPMSSSFSHRYFEKCPRYSSISHSDRVALYGVTDWLDTEGCFEGFERNVLILCEFRSRKISVGRENVIVDYCNFVRRFSRNPDTLRNALKKLYVLSLRMCWFVKLLNCSIDWLVRRIEEYWIKVDYDNLLQMYSYQEIYSRKFGSDTLIYMYPTFVKQIKELVVYNDFVKSVFDSFDIRDFSSVPPLKSTVFYQAYKMQTDGIYKDSHKAHEINSYLYSRKFGLLDPKLQTLLINYHSRKKVYEKKFK